MGKTVFTNMLCQQMKDDFTTHIATCPECLASIEVILNEVPFLSAMVGKETFQALQQKIGDLQNGKAEKIG